MKNIRLTVLVTAAVLCLLLLTACAGATKADLQDRITDTHQLIDELQADQAELIDIIETSEMTEAQKQKAIETYRSYSDRIERLQEQSQEFEALLAEIPDDGDTLTWIETALAAATTFGASVHPVVPVVAGIGGYFLRSLRRRRDQINGAQEALTSLESNYSGPLAEFSIVDNAEVQAAVLEDSRTSKVVAEAVAALIANRRNVQ